MYLLLELQASLALSVKHIQLERQVLVQQMGLYGITQIPLKLGYALD